ncbi:PAS domain-containing protein [Clostridium sp. MSJ-4]|uniref:PAS domain-containing protein n=1 Tax=Clostridium simiarum TaxID=2841506 RepID=A0ABS6EYI3_9CLOT|nr:ATP-binding protein [Clostridium simiarum]MBU5591131.1 PAS domain-containing protein [Clostridium simiarum]
MQIYNNSTIQIVIEALPYYVIIIDEKGEITHLNKLAEKNFLNYNKDLIGVNIFDIFHYHNIKLLNDFVIFKDINPIKKTIDEGVGVKDFSIKYDKKDKSIIFNMNSQPLIDNGEIKGALLSFSDITEEYIKNDRISKEREQFISLSTELKAKCNIIEILRSREKEHLVYLKDVISNISEGLIVLDANDEFNFCNRAIYRILNVKDVDSIDLRILKDKFIFEDLYTKGFEPTDYFKYCIVNRKMVKNVIFRLIDKVNKRIKYIEYNSNPIMNKNREVLYTIITIKDVTEIKEHEFFIEEQSTFIKDLVNAVDIPMAVIDYPSLKIKLANKNFEVFTKYILKGEKNININHNYWKDLFSEVEDNTIIEALEYCGKIGKEYTCSPYAIKDFNGKDRFYKIKFMPYNLNGDCTSGIYIYASDITEEINHSIELENVTRLKDEFFTVISHELRTPLTIIYSSLQLAYNIYFEEITPNVDKTLSRISQNCGRLLKLVNNILDISKAEAGFLNLNPLNFDAVVITEHVVTSVNHYANCKDINLIFDTSDEEYTVTMDKEKYEKILLNLISNAMKFTPEGNTILVELNFINGDMYLTVRDEGIGIPEDKIGFIFDRFAQVNSSLSRRAEGTGIGLSLVKKLVELMGGSIEVKSRVNIGSEFTIMFPKNIIEIRGENSYTIIDEYMSDKINIEFSDV